MDENVRFVDLPGYGYAKASKDKQKSWGRLVTDYIKKRRSLRGVVLIIDIRRGVGEMDQMFLDFFIPLNKSLHIILTKTDKINRQQQRYILNKTEELFGSIATIQLFSGTKKIGVSIAREEITSMLNSD